MPRRPLVLDELVDRVISRPLAKGLAAVLAPTPVTPNQVTLVSGACGVTAGVLLALGATWPVAVALLGFLVFDCADGQLARRRGGGSVYGRAFDGVGDYLTGLGVHVGLGFVMVRALGSIVAGVAAAVLAGLALIWASGLLDRYKRRYGGSRDDLAEIDAAIEGAKGFPRWLLKRFRAYAARLEADAVTIPDQEAYRAKTRDAMCLFLAGGPTTHYALLAVASAFGLAPWYVALALGPGALLTFSTLRLQRRQELGVVDAGA